MESWTLIILAILGIVGLFALVGLIRSMIRLVMALIGGVVMAGLAYGAVQWLEVGTNVPGVTFVVVGALVALFILIRS